jgi:ligand-binding sensor domain-containing protein
MRYFALIFLLSFNFLISAQDLFSVGTWRDHLPYAKINEVVILDDIYYAASPYSIISFDSNDNEIKKWNTITGLSEVGVTSIEVNENQHTVVVGYQSGNIDLIQNNNVVNMSAILNSGVIGDKSIYEIVAHNDFVYVCTGFGIVLIDLKKKEVKDTYFIGDNNSQVKVWDIHVGQDSIFALTDFGIKSASLSNSFLSDPSVWNYITNPTNKLFTKIEKITGALDNQFLLYNDASIDTSLLVNYSNGEWDTIFMDTNFTINGVVSYRNSWLISNNSYLVEYDLNMDTLNYFYAYNGTLSLSPNDALKNDGYYWIADDKRGFKRLRNNYDAINIGTLGPYDNDAFHLSCDDGSLWISAGQIDGTNWNKTYNWHGSYVLEDDKWSLYNKITIDNLSRDIDTVSDMIWSTIDPNDNQHVFVSSFSGGLIEYQEGSVVQRHTFYNSSLQTRINQNGNNVYVAGGNFDLQGNLWVANSFVGEPLSVLTPNGEWASFFCGSATTNQLCTDLIVDKNYGYIWMIVNQVGIVVYNYNQTPLDPSDDEYTILNTGVGSGALPSTFVNTLAIDNDGEVWVGTNEGPAVFYGSALIFSAENYDANTILIEENGTLQYLLENEVISDIVVDGANQKWIATRGGGLFLMSEDGTQTINAFSQENSPLFSDNIQALAINNITGELYIATELGVMGYKGNATAANPIFSSLKVYPNPVRPDYQGNIGISGTTKNAEIKITDANGKLVFTTNSYGGQAVWDGYTSSGSLAISGVYYVFATSEDGYSSEKTKLLLMR